MHRSILASLLLFAADVIVCSPQAVAQSSVYRPKSGSLERKAIMNALRVPVEKDLKMPVIFVVNHPEIFFRVLQNWAFVGADFRHPDGTRMPKSYFDKTNNSDTVLALLHRIHGRWRVVTHDTGAVDVEWPEWADKYHAPPALFPKVPMSTP